MKHLLLFTCSLFAISLNAQSLQWAKQYAGPSIVNGTDMAIDATGNVYTIGQFRQTVDFDPSAANFSLTSNGEADIFITKLDPDGNFLWAKQIGAQFFDDVPANIVVDVNGNILVAGYFMGTIDLDPGAGELNVTTQGEAAFLLKLDSQGDLIWAKNWGGTQNSDGSRVYNITSDGSGNIIIGGGFYGNSDLDPGAGTNNVTATFFEDAYISKLDANGDFLWAITFGGNQVGSRDYVQGIAVDSSGNILASGPFSGNIAVYNLMTGQNFYIKLDASGNLIWAKQTVSSSNVVGTKSLTFDATGNAYIVGRFGGTCDFDPGAGVFNLTSSGNFDIFILKLNTAGNFVWAAGFGSASSLDDGTSIALDNQGFLYTTGFYAGPADFDPSAAEFILTPVGFADMFISKLDTEGNFVYASTFGGIPNGFNFGNALIADNAGNVYATGAFEATTDFDPSSNIFNLVSAGSSDAFVLKLNGATLGIAENKLHSIKGYPNPNNGNFTIDLGAMHQDITVEITNTLGQIISSEKYTSTKKIDQQINSSTGIYFVKISTANGEAKTIKIIKN